MTLDNEDRNTMIGIYMEKSEKSLKSAIMLFEVEDYDSAANRAYYSTFQSEKALLLTKGIRGDSHKHIHNSLSKEFIKNGALPKDTNSKINDIQSARNMGDYSFESVTKKHAKDVIEEAKNFVDMVRNMISEYDKNNAIKDGKEKTGAIVVSPRYSGVYEGEIVVKSLYYAVIKNTPDLATIYELEKVPELADRNVGDKVSIEYDKEMRTGKLSAENGNDDMDNEVEI